MGWFFAPHTDHFIIAYMDFHLTFYYPDTETYEVFLQFSSQPSSLLPLLC